MGSTTLPAGKGPSSDGREARNSFISLNGRFIARVLTAVSGWMYTGGGCVMELLEELVLDPTVLILFYHKPVSSKFVNILIFET